MKKHLLAVMLLAASLMMTACGNGNNNQKNNTTPNENNEQKKEEVINTNTEDSFGIASIRKAWTRENIDVDPGDITPGIEQFALAFCKTYPQYDLNKVLMDYIISPNDYNKDEYEIVNDPRNGYIHCMWEVQTTPVTDVCYWNRNNDHKLIAAYMEDTHESGEWAERLVVFYDYDPLTVIMTPEPALTEKIEQRMNKYDDYSVILPQNGKDIVVVGYVFDEENDSADRVEFKLKWDGMTFEWDE